MSIKAITLRLSDKLHKAVKIKLINDNNKSFQEYVIGLIKRDIDFSDKDDDLSDYLPKK